MMYKNERNRTKAVCTIFTKTKVNPTTKIKNGQQTRSKTEAYQVFQFRVHKDAHHSE